MTLRISASSLDNTLLVPVSCCCIAVTIRLKICWSRSCSLANIESIFDIWTCSLLTAVCIRGFKAPCGFTASRSLPVTLCVSCRAQVLSKLVIGASLGVAS